MRQVQILTRPAVADAVMDLTRSLGARAPVSVRGEGDRVSLIIAQVPNSRVGELIEGVRERAEDAEVTVLPVGALPLSAPLDDVGQQVRDVSRLSSFEVVLSSLQSVGSWRGLLVYSALAGVIGSYAVIFDAPYLLVAAMLINPMAAPALVSVIGVTIGDRRMFGRGGLRFGISLAIQALSALLFGLAYGLESSSATMEQIASLSVWSVLLALAAGAAGAQTQIKSDRDSLVSGTAAGFMVAAALAPPAAVLGLSVPLGRWEYAGAMLFLLTLQYVAIVAGGSAALWFDGVRSRDPTLARGSSSTRNVIMTLVVLAGIGLAWFQLAAGPWLDKADLSRRARTSARQAISSIEGVGLVEVDARFTRSEAERYSREALIIDVLVERTGASAREDVLEERVRSAVRERVLEDSAGSVAPLVRVSIVPGERERRALSARRLALG